jgi:hypothetical protein
MISTYRDAMPLIYLFLEILPRPVNKPITSARRIDSIVT